jgi:hypothetical protein
MSSVLEKIDLADQRRVILHHAITPLTNKFRRAQVREESKVVNQMRLIVIPTIHRHSSPIRHSGPSHCFERSPKTPDTTKQLGRHADLAREQLNEAALTEASISRDIANNQAGVGSTESIERESHGVMTLQRPEQMRHERFLQKVKPVCRRFGFAQSFTKFCGRSPPKRFQVNMCVCQFACWRSKKRKRAAWFETHANDGNEFPRINHERSAMSPGNNCS